MTGVLVPEKITRQQLRDLVTSLGLDPDETLSMVATPEFITAEVYALDDQGQQYAVRDGGEPVAATQTIVIQVEEEDPDDV